MNPIRFAPLALVATVASARPSAPANDLGRVAPDAEVSATVALKLRNADQLDGLLRSLYDRGSPAFHKFLSADLPRFAVPRFIEVVDELPKTPTERVSKDAVRARGVSDRAWDAEPGGRPRAAS